MSHKQGSALIAGLIVISTLGFLWVGDFTLRLTEDISRERVVSLEKKHISAAQAEWDAFHDATGDADAEDGWQAIEYVIPDGVSERVVNLKIRFENGEWIAKDRQVVWRAKVVSL